MPGHFLAVDNKFSEVKADKLLLNSARMISAVYQSVLGDFLSARLMRVNSCSASCNIDVLLSGSSGAKGISQ